MAEVSAGVAVLGSCGLLVDWDVAGIYREDVGMCVRCTPDRYRIVKVIGIYV